MNGFEMGIAGGLAVFSLEAIKWLIRRFWVKNPEYDFPPAFYVVAVPVLAFAWGPLLGWLGFAEYVLPSDWNEWAKELVRVLVTSLVTLFGYNAGLKPLKEYRKLFKFGKG